jgi:peptidoglycan/LPS O-acetylase OafA/YrhL
MNREKSNRVAAFDGLRGIAIGLVLWQHMIKPFLPLERESALGWLRASTEMAWAGVDLFFVLSGFFIGGILIDRRASPHLGRVFYLRRALRILPLYYVVLAVLLAAVALHAPGLYHVFPAWVYAFFVSNFAMTISGDWDCLAFAILWSLAVEEQFYLIAPWVIRAISPARLPWLAAGLALLAWVLRSVLLLYQPNGVFAAHLLMPLRMDALALGVLVAWAVRDPHARQFVQQLWARRRPAVIGCLVVGGIALMHLCLQRPSSGSPALCLYGYTLIATLCAALLLIVAELQPPSLVRALSFRPLVHLGRHAYFVYLVHPLLGVGLIRVLGGPNFALNSWPALGTVILGIAATWGAAVLSWKYFEGPLVAVGQRHSY